MDRTERRRLRELRQGAGDIENNLIDELAAGEHDRSEFIRRGIMFGISIPTLGLIADAFGAGAAYAAPAARLAPKKGGTLKIAMLKPTSAVEPYLLENQGGLETAGIVGEMLTYSQQNLKLAPWLATSWKPNKDASQWTFQLRKDVKFHDGRPMTSKDVVSTYKRLVSKKSQAASAFKGVLSAGGIKAKGDYTIVFDLDAPTASFPYLTSQTTYQGGILPFDYKVGTFETLFPGTGPYKIDKYSRGRSARFVRNDAYWGGAAMAPLDAVEITYYEATQPQILALRAGQVDLVAQLSFQEAGPVFSDSKLQVFDTQAVTHREFCLRVDQDPYTDPRVRRAIALCLNRPNLVKTLFSGRGVPGNDSPFAPVYPSTNKSVPQRKQDLVQARQLLAAAGKTNASGQITTEQVFEIPQYAQIIQQSTKLAGFNFDLNIISQSEYFAGDPTQTPWLNAPATITDWGHRAVPNVFLTSAFKTGGVWNAAKYSNPALDKTIDSYLAAVDLKSQQKYSGIIESTLLKDTPVIISYFYNYLAAGTKKVQGYKADAIGIVNLRGVWKSA